MTATTEAPAPSGSTAEASLSITGMTCASCVRRVEKALAEGSACGAGRWPFPDESREAYMRVRVAVSCQAMWRVPAES